VVVYEFNVPVWMWLAPGPPHENAFYQDVTVMLKWFNIDQLVDAIGERLGADRALRPIDTEG
jgi:hypothetical protein